MEKINKIVPALALLIIAIVMGTSFYSCNKYGDGTKRHEIEQEKTKQMIQKTKQMQIQKGCKGD
jgi:hypothetical protein